jgi:hypothetical protein
MYISKLPANILDTKSYIREQTNECFYCQSKINLSEIYIDNKIYNACYMCKIIKNYKDEYVFDCLL